MGYLCAIPMCSNDGKENRRVISVVDDNGAIYPYNQIRCAGSPVAIEYHARLCGDHAKACGDPDVIRRDVYSGKFLLNENTKSSGIQLTA